MTAETFTQERLATVDVRDLQTITWGPLRVMFPSFVEDIELGRYIKGLLATRQCEAVQIKPHRDPDGRASTHVIDIYTVG